MSRDGAVNPALGYTEALKSRGGGSASRCYQCGTCTTVCELASRDFAFPRRQMVLTQWGMVEELSKDASVFLCHQCNDCSLRCPREAKPGDVMQTARALVVEELAVPRFMGRVVGKAAYTWPLLIGLPLLFWILVLQGVHGLAIPEAPFAYHEFVPHWLLYAVFFTTTGLASLSMGLSAWKYWQGLGEGVTRSGNFVGHTVSVLTDIMLHKRFGTCGEEKVRRWGHFSLFWGFVGAAVTSGFIVVAMYGFGKELPLPQSNPIKVLGNISAILLVVGVAFLFFKRFQVGGTGVLTSGFDGFLIGLVVMLVVTGILVEGGREWHWLSPAMSCYLYIAHLTVVLSLFATFPFSKFAHMVYRSLAMIHERMIGSET